MKEEIRSALNFIVNLIRAKYGKVSEKEFLLFIEKVTRGLYLRYTNHWFPESPLRGSAYRCIQVNGIMDPLVGEASSLLGLKLAQFRMVFPSELTLWIDPEEVSYRIGDDTGSICVLYKSEPKIKSPSPPLTPPQHSYQSSPPPTPSSPLGLDYMAVQMLLQNQANCKELFRNSNDIYRRSTANRYRSLAFDSGRGFGGERMALHVAS